jgi:hypothetical protein
MAFLQARRPATAATVGQPPKNVLSAKTNSPQNNLRERQAQRICEFIPISILAARVIADLHYGMARTSGGGDAA